MATAAVTALVALECGDLTGMGIGLAMVGCGTLVAVLRIEVIVHTAVEVCGAMEPVSGANEMAANEPLGSIVAVGCTVVGSVVIVAVRARGLRAKVDTDRNLRMSSGYR